MARFALIVACAIGFLVTAAAENLLLPALRSICFAGPARPWNGPAWQKKKNGTPTMGGIAFILGTLAAVGAAWCGLEIMDAGLLSDNQKMNLTLALLCAFLFGAVGFFDDVLRIARRRDHGLRVWQKLVLETLATAVFLMGLQMNGVLDTGMVLPFFGYVDFGWWYWPFSFVLILCTVTSAQLTDGVDGLCSCTAILAMLACMVVCSILNNFQLSVFASAVAGSLLAFLLWNFYPAKVFMGSTGSMFLGGALVAAAYCMGWPGLLPLLAGVYLLEGASLALQVLWFRLSRGKRLFRTAPLHHALAMAGWSEVRITAWLTALEGVFVVLAMLFVRIS